jgi:hypothetical protein
MFPGELKMAIEVESVDCQRITGKLASLVERDSKRGSNTAAAFYVYWPKQSKAARDLRTETVSHTHQCSYCERST